LKDYLFSVSFNFIFLNMKLLGENFRVSRVGSSSYFVLGHEPSGREREEGGERDRQTM
jgi:hypothetical protein